MQVFLSGEDIELTSDEEKLFLSQAEQNERRRKIAAIWQRMLPPKMKSLPEKKQTQKRRITSTPSIPLSASSSSPVPPSESSIERVSSDSELDEIFS